MSSTRSSPTAARPFRRPAVKAEALLAAAALDCAVKVDSGRAADRVLQAAFDQRRWSPADRGRIARLILGIQRSRRQLDWWLDRAGVRPAPLARLVAALLLLEKLPKAAVMKHLPRLPAIEAKAIPVLEGRTLDHPDQPPAVAANLPDWLAKPLQARFGPRFAVEIEALNGETGLNLRVNALKASRDEVVLRLAAEDIAAKPTVLSPLGLRVDGRPALARTAVWRDGLFEVQDEASQLAALLVGARPGERVLDFCAGAGGKTLALAGCMANKGRLSATDIDARRLTDAGLRLRRAGVHNAECHALVAGDSWLKRRRGSFDRVLVDAPCSGTGTWRRNPDAKWRSSADELDRLIALQDEVLARAATLVRPGGTLVYATCSVLTVENEERVTAFLGRHPEFRVVPLSEAWSDTGSPAPAPGPGPYLVLTPARHGTDGFFAARLVRQTAP